MREATAYRSEGALLPADLLQRIQAGDPSLPALTPQTYHLPGSMRLNEAASRAWNALLGAWKSFRDAADNLPEGELGTSITRERWLLPLFQELNYGRLLPRNAAEIDGKSYAISHGYGHAPIHLVGFRVDLDRRTRGVAGAAHGSPHSLLQEYLNRTEDTLWGIVSNGLSIRVLRDNLRLTRPAYLEFDLQAMMEGEQYSDFVLLYLVLHQSRLEAQEPEQTVLEQWMLEAQASGARVLDGLSDGVRRAISSFGKGFLAYPGNNELREKLRSGELSPDDFYRQLLRLVYRLLFMFVAEDRNLLHPPEATEESRERYSYYSTRRLRDLSGSMRGGRHPDLFESLKVVMRALGGDGAPGLGLPALGSFLFSERATPDLMKSSLSNGYLLQAVRALAWAQVDGVRRSVDYKNLGTEELGSVYEGLLELHPQVDTHAPDFELASAAGNDRKTTGSYYTPASLINLLLDNALDPVIDEAVRGKDIQQAEQSLLNLKIVDPACGSGHFLMAAAQRLAKRLASVRTGDDEPAPDQVRSALRDVVSTCIYGVDINEMAAELCKVSLWLEALDPGRPLTFLEHRIRVGNSLIGTTPQLLEGGIPDDAFKPIEGDDKKFATAVRKKNWEERSGQAAGLFDQGAPGAGSFFSDAFAELNALPTDDMEQLRKKERRFQALQEDAQLRASMLAADAWCAAFVWPIQRDEPEPLTTGVLRRLQDTGELGDSRRDKVEELAEQYNFFHWHLAFPEVFGDERDGFDVVLGNPPWEHTELKEKEWFATRRPEIAQARTGALRKKYIQALQEDDPTLFQAFAAAKRQHDATGHFATSSGMYPLCGRGRINTYPLFAELGRTLIGSRGRVGNILPSGIATDDTTKFFFQDLVERRSLVSLLDFENRQGIFPGVHRSYKFCLLTLTGADRPANEAEFVFFALNPSDVRDPEKRFTLTPEEIELLNPNTKTCPVFRSRRDAEITKTIYRRVPVLVNEQTGENPWGVTFRQGLFNMTSDSNLFRTRVELESEGFELQGNRFVKDEQVYLPLYEAKMMHQFDHRFATYTEAGDTRNVTSEEKADPSYAPLPRYWVAEGEVRERLVKRRRNGEIEWEWKLPWMLAFRRVARSTDERSGLFTLLPGVPSGDSIFLAFPEHRDDQSPFALTASLNSFCLDYVVRQKISGMNMSFYLVNQFPVLPPVSYSTYLLTFVSSRVMELSITSLDFCASSMPPNTTALPSRWNANRRFWLRAELDALYFHLYGIERDDVDYIMETFPIVKRKDEEKYGCYRTKDAILEIYDEMARCRAESREYETRLDPPPAHPSLAHGSSSNGSDFDEPTH